MPEAMRAKKKVGKQKIYCDIIFRKHFILCLTTSSLSLTDGRSYLSLKLR
jgi:hypothetical protein